MTSEHHPVETHAQSSSPFERFPSPTYLWFLGLLSLPAILLDRAVVLAPFALCFLFGFWPVVSMLGSGLRESTTEDPTAWIDFGGGSYERLAAVSSMLLLGQPYVLFASARQVLGAGVVAVRHRGRLPGPDDVELSTSYRPPFDGEWTVVNGSPDRRHSHSWGIYAQRYAYDFLITDEAGRTRDGTDRSRDGAVEVPDAHYCFGEPVLAPADGVVIAVRNDHPDHDRTDGWLDLSQRDIRGNYVTIEHATSEYSVLAHLQRGSVIVEEGQHVQRGERVGRCGHSGNSTEPHLHFQLQDGPDFFASMGLPIPFDDVTTRFPDATGEFNERAYVHSGQLVEYAPELEPDARPAGEGADRPSTR